MVNPVADGAGWGSDPRVRGDDTGSWEEMGVGVGVGVGVVTRMHLK